MQKLDNAECRYVPALSDDQLEGFCWETDWRLYKILGYAPRRPQFRDYIAAIDEFEDEYFDIIAIDGRERVACLVHAIPKLRPGGVLVLDDSNRPKYGEFSRLLQEWSIVRLPFGRNETSMFLKP